MKWLGGAVATTVVVVLAACTGAEPDPVGSESPTQFDGSAFVGNWGMIENVFWYLEINQDGSFRGDDRCAIVEGQWEMIGSTEVRVTDVTVAGEGCSSELPWVTPIKSIALDGDTLVVVTEGRAEPWLMETHTDR